MELTIDKYKTGELLEKNNIRVPKSYLVNKETDLSGIQISFPCIVKPKDEGSSFSLYKPANKEELYNIINKELEIRDDILIQEFVVGREITCGVIEYKGRIEALLPTEVILTKGELFDYEAKYTIGGCEEITPPKNLEERYLRQIQELAIRVFQLCDCKDIARVDVILTENGDMVVLEINTLPGMSEYSFIPQQLIATGYSIKDFIQGMLNKYIVQNLSIK
ncbi:MAG: ATP-grasp domain-containing protein [Cyanobium sp. MAG06]|nr:ATP-grasp domain-containing protein [Cyanobium sp. MAG06]